jgi:EmrB/QacA subfamily drug resistance transporter
VTAHKEIIVRSSRPRLTLAIVSVALFMVTLDNLVVSTALPTIRLDLGASLGALEWTVNAYTLTYAVFLLTGAALGDRLGRRRMFVLGLGLFTAASALAAVAPSTETLIAARAVQGIGAAIVTPLTLTLLSTAFPAERRGAALGIWSGVSGLGVALGPLVGGLVVDGLSWQWIFWLNVPLGLTLVPLAARWLSESRGPAAAIDAPGVALGSLGLLGIVYGLVEGNSAGWSSAQVLGALAAGIALLAAFVAWEARAAAPVVPLRFFRSRAFSATGLVSLIMYFGLFGSIFLLVQVFQTAQGYSALESGLRTLPWTGMPMLVAPIAGLLSDRVGSRPLIVAGLTLQAVAIGWLAAVAEVATPYGELVPGFVLAGVGMAMVFAPATSAVLGAVRTEEAGQASGAMNTFREVGGVMGVAVLAAVFSANGSYASPADYMDGVGPALWLGAAVLAVGAAAALLIPGRARSTAAATPAPVAAVAEPVPA